MSKFSYPIAIILAVIWLAGLIFFDWGDYVHLLLVLAFIILVFKVIGGNRM